MPPRDVAPLAGAWIEIKNNHTGTDSAAVAPLAGAWIEINIFINCGDMLLSLPSRERGLKYPHNLGTVACGRVAPLAGAWIEIMPIVILYIVMTSLPSRERGLKSVPFVTLMTL